MAYHTSATTKGGRNGRAMLDNGALALAMAAAEGNRRRRRRPQSRAAVRDGLFRLLTARPSSLLAKKHGVDGQAAKVTADVTLNTDAGFASRSS